MGWFAIRHVVKNADAYEERITLWESGSFAEAIARAESEVAEYASLWETGEAEPLSLYQSFELDGAPRDGAEVFSLCRRSQLLPDAYLDSFFSTGSELEQNIDQ
jgi:hypothetical protein